MKRCFILLIATIFALPTNVSATGGALRKATIKTCPNGITYGLHSDGQGGTHWHVAITNGQNYYPDGSALPEDPCPGVHGNQGTAGSTSGSSNSTTNNSGKNESNRQSSNSNNISNSNSSTNNNTEVTENNKNTQSKKESNNSNNKKNAKRSNKANKNRKNNKSSKNNSNKDNSKSSNTNKKEEVNNNESDSKLLIKKTKSNDTSIKKLTIDGKLINLSKEIVYETNKNKVKIKIIANDENAEVTFNNKELKIGDNLFEVVVTAENGEEKKYNFNIKRNKIIKKAKFKEFIFNGKKLTFNNNEEKIIIYNNNQKVNYSYKLNDTNNKVAIYQNNKKVDEIISINNNDIIKLLLINENGESNEYTIMVEKLPKIVEKLGYIIAIWVMLILLKTIIGILYIVVIKIKKTSNNVKKQ